MSVTALLFGLVTSLVAGLVLGWKAKVHQLRQRAKSGQSADPKLSGHVEGSKQLSNWLTVRINRLSFTFESRSGYSVGCLDMALELCDAIVLLIDRRIVGSAFSLLRPMFESYIRGIWLFDCARENDLERYSKDKSSRSVTEMIDELEKLPAYSNGALSTSWEDQKKLLHSFTHSGFQQVKRRFTARGVEPNYLEEETIGALHFVNAIAIMCVIGMARVCGNEDLARDALEKSKEYSA